MLFIGPLNRVLMHVRHGSAVGVGKVQIESGKSLIAVYLTLFRIMQVEAPCIMRMQGHKVYPDRVEEAASAQICLDHPHSAITDESSIETHFSGNDAFAFTVGREVRSPETKVFGRTVTTAITNSRQVPGSPEKVIKPSLLTFCASPFLWGRVSRS